jgi:hypothetical protein
MYLTASDARGKTSVNGSRLSGLGFAWSDITTGISNLIKSPDVAKLATSLIAKQTAAPTVTPTIKPMSLSVVSGGGTMPTQYAAPASIWSNKWTWVAAGAGLLLAGTALALVMRRRD